MQAESKQLTEALGLQTLSLYDAGRIVHPELSRLCERINELRSEIAEKKRELEELKAQATSTKCSQCQADVLADAEFCPKCGARLREKAAPPAAGPAAQARTVVRLRCPRCKTILSAEAESCPTCGVKIVRPQTQAAPADRHFCPSCGAETKPNARFCPICGRAIP